MASYSADIRIGVVGKGQLNQLESQLKRVNSAVSQLNKQLQLRARVQAVRLDTRQAMSAVRALEARINRLGRTITVNLRTNEQQGRRSGGGGSTAVVVPQQRAQNIQTATQSFAQLVAASQDLTRIQKTALKNEKTLNDLLQTQIGKRNELQAQVEKIRANRTEAQNIANGFGSPKRLNQLNFGYDALIRKLQRLQSEYKAAAGDVRNFNNAADNAVGERIATVERRKQQVMMLRRRKQEGQNLKRSAGAGLLAGGLNISGPVGGIINAGVAGAAFAGPKGAAIAATVAAVTELTAGMSRLGKQSAETYAEFAKFQMALKSVAGSDFEAAMASARQSVDDFNTPITDAIQQITKLTAAGKANGLTMTEINTIYQGLGAANKALGGDSEKLQGILLATTQVLSKGKVQAEELRGQIGERLPGAFALFAQAIGKTPAELDKALEKGEVSIEDFVTFSRKLLEKYADDAKLIAESPSEAGARLQKALADLNIAIGPLFASLGAQFQNFATNAVNALTPLLDQMLRFLQISNAGKADRISQINDQLGKNATRNQELLQRLGETGVAERISVIQGQSDALEKERARLQGEIQATTKATDTSKPRPSGNLDKDKKGRKPRDRVAELTAELALERQLLEIVNRQTVGSQYQRDLAAEQLKRSELAAELERDKKDVASSNLTTQSKVLANQVLDARYTRELAQLDKDRAQYAYERKRSMDDTVRDLETQLKLESAITEQDRIRIEGAARLAGLNRDDYSQDEYSKLAGLNQQITDAQLQNANPLVGFAKELTAELANTDQMLVDIAQTLQTNVSSAFSQVFTGLITGTQSAQQTLANFFRATGEAFVAMAMEIISKQLVMIALQSVLKALGGASGSSGGPETDRQFMDRTANLDLVGGYGGGLAKGGPASAGTAYTVGEKGPELFIPGQTGTVVPNDIFEATRKALTGGAGGSDNAFADNGDALAVADSYTRERVFERDRQTMFTGAGGSTTIQTQVINSVEYATVDQVQKASEQSAKRARAQVFADMRNKPSTRTALGMS